jgi:TPR repeat protein
MAINMIGRCYDLGWGVDVDKARAAEWFRIAADQGLDWGMYNYATLLALGQGVPEDRPAALALLRKAASMGNAKAMNFVGSFYEDGWVVDRDMDSAADYYRRAADGGDFPRTFQSCEDAGRCGRRRWCITLAGSHRRDGHARFHGKGSGMARRLEKRATSHRWNRGIAQR